MKKVYAVAPVLDALGIEYTEEVGEYRALCPMHKTRIGREDHSPSWYINAESGLHLCFSCGYKGNLLKLVQDVRGIDAGQAQSLLIESEAGMAMRTSNISMSIPVGAKKVALPNSSLALFTDPPDWALSRRRISATACAEYGVLWDEKRLAWILPIRDRYEDLIGWQVKGEMDRHFRNYPVGVKKAESLFGLDALGDQYGAVIVVESPLDAVRLGGLGYLAVAVYGARVSGTQADMLAQYVKLILAFDADEAGTKAREHYLENYGMRNECWVIDSFDGAKDFGDVPDDKTIEDIIRSATPPWGRLRA